MVLTAVKPLTVAAVTMSVAEKPVTGSEKVNVKVTGAVVVPGTGSVMATVGATVS